MARSGLTIGEDPGLAWELVAALYNEGKITEAREALARHQPRPGTQDEIRLWMQLHLGAAVAAEDARVMVDLANRQPSGVSGINEFTAAIRSQGFRESASGLRWPMSPVLYEVVRTG